MPLDKAINSGKEHRKKYYGEKSVDRTCRNHDSCPHCQMRRKYKNIKRELSSREQMEEVNGRTN